MGHAEEAQINLGRAKLGDELSAQLAQAHGTLAVLAAIEELSSQVAYLSEVVEGKKPEPRTGDAWS